LKGLQDAALRVTLLDVRTPLEHRICRLEDSKLIPLMELPERFSELDRSEEIVVYCHHGNRSARAVDFLRRMGFENTRNLSGGINAWSLEIDPSVPRY
jgi:adenylyltransferase/sulfurtransferase